MQTIDIRFYDNYFKTFVLFFGENLMCLIIIIIIIIALQEISSKNSLSEMRERKSFWSNKL